MLLIPTLILISCVHANRTHRYVINGLLKDNATVGAINWISKYGSLVMFGLTIDD